MTTIWGAASLNKYGMQGAHKCATLSHTLRECFHPGRVAIAKKKLSYEVIFLHYAICLPMLHMVLHVHLTTKTL